MGELEHGGSSCGCVPMVASYLAARRQETEVIVATDELDCIPLPLVSSGILDTVSPYI